MPDPVPEPLHDPRWEDSIPRAGYHTRPERLVAHLMSMYDLPKPDAEAVLERHHPEQIQTLVNRRYGTVDGEWQGVAL